MLQNFTTHSVIPFELPSEILETDVRDQPLPGRETVKLIIHRGHIFQELFQSFEQHDLRYTNIQLEMLLPTGESEKAEDIGGVFRDVLSEFWSEFYEKCTVGTNFKVPFIRHDYGEKQWTTVADIFLKGFQDENYFPVKLAPVFMKSVFEKPVTNSDLVDNFLSFISELEANTLQTAMQNFSDVDKEELLDTLSVYECKWNPTEENISQLITDIAHQELIQKPAFVIQSFKLRIFNNVVIDLDSIYERCIPTAKNILQKLSPDKNYPNNSDTNKVVNYLKKFIKESDICTREKLLRFITGSNIVMSDIQIIFNNLTGLQRRPIAHTCTTTIELSTDYENYLEFRNDLNEIFKSNVWIMDIV